jgi:hypothetical protein
MDDENARLSHGLDWVSTPTGQSGLDDLPSDISPLTLQSGVQSPTVFTREKPAQHLQHYHGRRRAGHRGYAGGAPAVVTHSALSPLLCEGTSMTCGQNFSTEHIHGGLKEI